MSKWCDGVNDLADACVPQVWVFARLCGSSAPLSQILNNSSITPDWTSEAWDPVQHPRAPPAHGHSGTLAPSASHEWILVVLQLLYRRAAAAGKRNRHRLQPPKHTIQEQIFLFSVITCSSQFLFPCRVQLPVLSLFYYPSSALIMLVKVSSTINIHIVLSWPFPVPLYIRFL